MRIHIGPETFNSQKDARSRASQVLHAHRLWQPITGDDGAFVSGLFALHPDTVEKSGPGVRCFVVGQSFHGPQLNLFVIRTDGTVDDFSIRRAVAAAATTREDTPS
ncbi:DCL family protein [Propionibacterium freudenreichii]|uniref:DCL family protein n=1 Tax=Propionibacterium freudenreichii TaxID=1744 RepID=UPI00254AB842|nr:DCL family protein [Propionibacterium freudenreichii]MDK9661427.1 DUF3223 domain-containing protein [Propionibacterium freudenreichii]